MLVNNETGVNVSDADIEELESVDRAFLRQMLQTPKSSPKNMFFNLGCTPMRFIIKAKILVFLHNIL